MFSPGFPRLNARFAARFAARLVGFVALACAVAAGTESGPDPLPPATATADSAGNAQDTLAQQPPAKKTPIPDSAWRWPANPRLTACAGPYETVGQCTRQSPRRVLLETGFPGLRAAALNLTSLEPARAEAFHQGALAQSPYGTGGHMPFDWIDADAARGTDAEGWTPVQPLDTPVTDLHWMRGALLMNQFGLKLRRMAGNRAYVALDYFSNTAAGQYYEYAFNVHQPYLGAGRDSLSLVIEDSSHAISSRHMRPRLGFWIDRRTVVEAWADWLDNSTSMANPTNPGENDSIQLLYPASFAAATFGGTVARAGNAHRLRMTFRHAAWERSLAPRGAAQYAENAAGIRDALDAEWTWVDLPGEPRLTIAAENSLTDGALRTKGAGSGVAANARGDRLALGLDARPDWGFLALDLRGDAARRTRPVGATEMLAGGDADARILLPWGFGLSGGAGWSREGAPEDNLFRWQPALGLYPNPDLAPRTHARHGGGAGWESRHLAFGAEWERHRFENTWLPRILPQPGVCALLLDTTKYADENAACFAGANGGVLPDSLALAFAGYEEETRELLHLDGRLSLGNWTLNLRHTRLIANAVRDPRLGFTAQNWRLPENVIRGRLLWKRRVLDGKLGLQTRWDWEWISARYAFASDLDGTSRLVPLDEYLALDFTAQMEIKTFLLFFRAMNLYHDRYATEPGVHPPGVNFRFGVDWRLRN